MRSHRPTLVAATVGVIAFLVPAAGAYALWSVPATGTLTVSTATAVSTPALSCLSSTSNILEWTESGASYRVYSSSSQNTGYTLADSPSTRTYTASLPGNTTRYFRVSAVGAGGSPESAQSNTVRIVRTGAGASNNYTCTGVS